MGSLGLGFNGEEFRLCVSYITMRIRVLKPPISCALGLLDLVCVPHSRKPRVVSYYDTFLRKDVLLFHSRAKISNFNQMEMRNWGILWCVCTPWQKQLWFCWWMDALGLRFNGMIWRIPIMCLLYVAMRIRFWRRVPVDCWKILLIFLYNGLSRDFEV